MGASGPEHAQEAERLLDAALLEVEQLRPTRDQQATRDLIGLVLLRAQLHAQLAQLQFSREILDELQRRGLPNVFSGRELGLIP